MRGGVFTNLSIWILLLSLPMMSCKVMYQPPMHNVPMFKEKGELQATIALKNAQLAYAVTNKIGVMANGFFRTMKVKPPFDGYSSYYKPKSYGLDLGVGFCARDYSTSMEFFAGYGFGKAELNQAYEVTGFTGHGGKSNFHKIFIQPTMILRRKETDFGFTFGSSLINFYNFADMKGQQLKDETSIFVEPSITLSKRISAFSIRLQAMASLPLGQVEDFGEYFPYKEIIQCNVGVTANLSKLFPAKGEK